MIHYTLQCSEAHGFDGWFASSAAFDDQVARQLVVCPICNYVNVSRGLMAPGLGRKSNAAGTPEPAPPRPMAVAGPAMPDQLRAALQKLRSDVERNCDYVGPEFADEARRIHAGKSERRGIYGEASPEQAEALAEDGIPVARVPWVPRADG